MSAPRPVRRLAGQTPESDQASFKAQPGLD